MKSKNYRAYLGAMGEALVAADLLKNGFNPHIPLTNNSPYDILVTKGSIRFRIQVKYRSIQRGAVEVTMRRSTQKGYVPYKDGFDILALVTEGNRIAYLHRSELEKSITLRIYKSKNNQSKHVNQFSKYQCIHAAIIRSRNKSITRLG